MTVNHNAKPKPNHNFEPAKTPMISKESTYCGSKSDFYKKSWPNYAALVVQIRLTSSEIDSNLYEMFEIPKYVFTFKPRVICTYKVVYYFLSLWMFLFRGAILVSASQKKPVLTLIKWKMGFLFNENPKPRSQHYHTTKIQQCVKYGLIPTNFAMSKVIP